MPAPLRDEEIHAYLKDLHVLAAPTPDMMLFLLNEKFATEQTKAFSQRMFGENQKPIEREEFYPMKNQDLTSSLIISGSESGIVFFDILDWIKKHPQLFGKTILDIGCDNGLLTCYIARMLPESQVVGIDLYDESVACGRELASRLGLTNVTFRKYNLFDGPFEQFDTVFCSQCATEHFSIAGLSVFGAPELSVTPMAENATPFFSAIGAFVRPGGRLISVERNSAEEYPLAKGIAIGNGGCLPDWENSAILDSHVFGLTIKLHFLPARKPLPGEAEEQLLTPDAVSQLYYDNLYYPGKSKFDSIYPGMAAEAILRRYKGEKLVELAFYVNEVLAGNTTCYLSRELDPPRIILSTQKVSSVKRLLRLFSLSEKERVNGILESTCQQYEQKGGYAIDVDSGERL